MALSILTFLALLIVPAAVSAQTVNVYNWNDYIGETTLEDFSAETGLDVNYDVFESLELLEQKLFVGNSGYDVIVPTAQPTLARLIQAGALQTLDRTKIPNWDNLDTVLMQRIEATDPDNRHAAIYQWGTIGLGIVPEKITALLPDAPLGSFDLLFDPEVVSKLAPCGVTLLDSAIDTFPTVLNYLGLDPNSGDPADLAQAEALLQSVRPFIKNFVTGQTINNLAAGDTCVALAYSGDVLQAAARAEEANAAHTVTYVVPKEGVQIWFDVLAVPVDAPNPDAAHAFINFILRPEIMAEITNYVQYGNAVPASLPMVDDSIRTDPAVFPSIDAKRAMFSAQVVAPSVDRLRTRIWTRVVTGQ